MRVAYMFRGQLWYANKKAVESPLAAVTRSLKRRLGVDVTLWYSGRESENEIWRVQWVDPKAETFEEADVRI